MSEETPINMQDSMVTWGDGDVLGSIISGANGPTELASTSATSGYSGNQTRVRPEHLFANSMVARKAVTVIPDQALPLFKGWTQRKKQDEDFEAEAFEWWLDNLYAVMLDACYMARTVGDAYIILFFDDGNSMDQPLDVENIKEFYGAVAKSRHEVNPIDGFKPEESRLFSVSYTAFQQNFLRLRQHSYMQSQSVHATRIFHIPGILMTSYIKSMNNGENGSIIGYIEKFLKDWEEGNSSGVEMLKSHSAFILGIKGLAVSVRTKNVDLLTERFKSMLQGLKGLKTLIFDADKEKADVINRTYSGIQPVIAQLDKSLANSVDFPKDYLINDASPFDSSGLGARYEMAQIIDRYYLSHLRKPLRRLFVLYCGWKKQPKRAEKFDLDVVSSLQLTREEEGRVRFKNAQTDALYLARQNPEDQASAVLSLGSVQTRWESGRYSDEITFIPHTTEPRPPVDPETKVIPAGKSDKQSLKNVTNTITSKSGRSAYNGQDVK
jgi:Protein of unknown function (DUF1073)